MEGAAVRPPRGVFQLRSREPRILHGDRAGAVAGYSRTNLAARRRHAAESAPPVVRAAASPPGSGALTTPVGALADHVGSRQMTAADFRRVALSLEGVEEYSHAGF